MKTSKRKTFSLVASTLLTILPVSLFGIGCVIAKGPSVSRDFDFKDFNKIEVGSAFNVEISPSDSYKVTVAAPESLFDYLDISNSGETLRIQLKPFSGSFGSRPKAMITLPALYSLDISGASLGSVTGFKLSHDIALKVTGASTLTADMESTGTMKSEISGASKLKGQLKVQGADIEISGASTIELGGSSGNMSLHASGASRANLSGFTLQTASATLSGASKSAVNVSGKLDVDLSGASTLDYSGNPALGAVNVTGSSTLRKK